MEARIILSCSPPVHPSVVSQLYFTMFDILPKTWFLQCSPRLFVLHFHVSAGFCQQRLTTWDNYWIFWRSTKTPFRPMHLDFQREEDVCTETCDRIDTVITIVIKTVTKLAREPTVLNLLHPSTLTSLPTYPSTLPPLVTFSLHLFNDLSNHIVHSPLSSS